MLGGTGCECLYLGGRGHLLSPYLPHFKWMYITDEEEKQQTSKSHFDAKKKRSRREVELDATRKSPPSWMVNWRKEEEKQKNVKPFFFGRSPGIPVFIYLHEGHVV